ncbi:hypothetical protein Peur_009863 [Populus x canadensis]
MTPDVYLPAETIVDSVPRRKGLALWFKSLYKVGLPVRGQETCSHLSAKVSPRLLPEKEGLLSMFKDPTELLGNRNNKNRYGGYYGGGGGGGDKFSMWGGRSSGGWGGRVGGGGWYKWACCGGKWKGRARRSMNNPQSIGGESSAMRTTGLESLRNAWEEEDLQLSYHKFNVSQREQTVLRRMKQGEVVVLLISDAGTPGIGGPDAELLCMDENIPVTPIPGPCGVVSALSASGLATNEFTFVGFLPRHGPSRKERLMASANEARTQIFYVLPHKFSQSLKEFSSLFGVSRYIWHILIV